jgi:hypothetical protein
VARAHVDDEGAENVDNLFLCLEFDEAEVLEDIDDALADRLSPLAPSQARLLDCFCGELLPESQIVRASRTRSYAGCALLLEKIYCDKISRDCFL